MKKMTEISYKHLRPLIDGDILLYRCGFAADSQVKKEYKENNPGASDEEIAAYMAEYDYTGFALGNAKEVIKEVGKLFDDSNMRVFLTGHGNFREQVATILPYKGNRDPTHKPKYYKEIKQYLIDVWNAEVIHGCEADDALGCAQWAAKDRSTVLCTIDKDLDMIPGHHYNFVKKEYYYVGKEYADMRLFYQMLTGDRTDNIPGINKIGDVRATKLLDECKGDLAAFRSVVREKYKEQYGDQWEQAYHEVGNLLWIRRVEGQECPFL